MLREGEPTPIEAKEPQEKLKEREFRIGIIADTHEIENPEEIVFNLNKLKEEIGPTDLDVHLGDLAAGPLERKLAKEFKKKIGNLYKERRTGALSEESEEFQKLIESEGFKQLLEDGYRPTGAYISLKLKEGKHREEALNSLKKASQKVAKALTALKPDLVYVLGNVDWLPDKERREIIQRSLKEQEIPSITEPQFKEIDKDNALIFWPFPKTNPEKDPQAERNLSQKVKELVKLAQDKKNIVILGHEHILRGPSSYKEQAEKAGFEEAIRIPRLQPAWGVRHLISLLRQLPKEAKIAYVFGHLHDPKEVMLAGMPYLKEEKGIIPFGIGIPGTKEYKTIDLIYLPQGKAGILEIKKEGFKLKEK